LLRAGHAMLFGPAPPTAVSAGGWMGTAAMAVAFLLLILTGIAWPPGLAAALDLAARAVLR